MPQAKSNEIPHNRSLAKDNQTKEKASERKRLEVETTIESDDFSTKITITVRH